MNNSENENNAFSRNNQAYLAAPVAQESRIKLIDMLRGVALLGILMMNIPYFAMPDYFSESFRSDPTSANFWTNAVITIFFEGKMRALFSMIFGAGILLFTTKKEQAGKSATGLFYRRMAWLVLFGLIHAHIMLWIGDILYFYGVIGMLAYLFRNMKPIYLVMGIPLVAIFDFVTNTMFYQDLRAKRIDYVEAVKAQNENKTLTDAQTKSLTTWRQVELTLIPNREDAAKNTQKMKSNYSTVANYIRPLAWDGQTKYLIYGMGDILALMLLGIAMYKWGFLTGDWSDSAYKKTMLIGYGIGLPLVMYSFYYHFLHYPNLETNLAMMEKTPIVWVNLIYPFQRILLVMAHVSALILIYKSGIGQSIFKRLEAVGQMAFTNYVSHTAICTLFFFGYGLNHFGDFQFYQLYFIVGAIWLFQLIVSPIWLKHFYFGPLEWLWRSLTYWKLQPFKK